MAELMVTSHYAVVTHGPQCKHHVKRGDSYLPDRLQEASGSNDTG